MKKILLIILLFLFSMPGAFSQNDREYTKTLKKMFEVSGSSEAYQVAIKQLMEIYRKNYTHVSTEVLDGMEKEFLNTSLDDLVEMLVPVYLKYMTQADLEEMIKFYQSPVGRKFARNTPAITQESMQVGQEWGKKMGEAYARKVKEKGY